MAPLPPRDQRHRFLRCEGLEYTDSDIADFELRLERTYTREIHRVQVVDFLGMPDLLRDSLFARMTMEHCDKAGYELPPSLICFLCQTLQRFRRHASHTQLFD
ncbi:hypothetical protein Tco_0329622 [Tanacetum coccineum]